ncbi:MAG: phosphatidylglycerophosphatase A [Desulfomonilaceae bacterium]
MSKFSSVVKAGLCSGFWLGYSPVASGTVGTIPAIIFYLWVARNFSASLQTLMLLLGLIMVSILTVALGPWAESYWNKKDPSKFVLDEVAGFLFTVLFFRTPDMTLTFIWAFLATRFFDIVKPPPAFQAQSAPGGWGILLDDLIASFYAAIFLHMANWVFPWAFGST